MSEPMSSGEIEDVLSSIRRLVSEDLRPATPTPAAQKPAGPDTAAPKPKVADASGKLLLTPALRVVGQAEATLPPARPSAAAPVAPAPQALNDRHGDDPFADDAQASAEEADDTELDWDDVDPAPTADAEAEDWLPEEAPMQVDHELPDWDMPKPAPKSAPKSDAATELNRVVSEIGAAVHDDADEWEPETGDSPMSAMSWKAPEWVEEAEVVADSVEAAERDAVARALADKAEAAAVAEIMARAAAAKAEAEVKAQAAETPREDSKATPDPDLFAEDEGYFDETVLRDLVRDLIREELSGTLGERITRNVRKLVRAEINRALTARDFD